MQISRVAKVAALSLAPLTLVGAAYQASASPAPVSDQDIPPAAAAFSVSAVSADKLTDVSGVSADSPEGRTLQTQGFGVLRAASGETAVVDSSMTREGITSATGKGFVELSWKGYAKDARYVVTRDGEDVATLAAGVTSYRDTTVKVPKELTLSMDFDGPVEKVTVYDADDKVLAETDFGM